MNKLIILTLFCVFSTFAFSNANDCTNAGFCRILGDNGLCDMVEQTCVYKEVEGKCETLSDNEQNQKTCSNYPNATGCVTGFAFFKCAWKPAHLKCLAR